MEATATHAKVIGLQEDAFPLRSIPKYVYFMQYELLDRANLWSVS
jgi:hypothetical protein